MTFRGFIDWVFFSHVIFWRDLYHKYVLRIGKQPLQRPPAKPGSLQEWVDRERSR